jgi:hypothetical protein
MYLHIPRNFVPVCFERVWRIVPCRMSIDCSDSCLLSWYRN